MIDLPSGQLTAPCCKIDSAHAGMLAAFQEFGIARLRRSNTQPVLLMASSSYYLQLPRWCQNMVAAVQADLQVIFHIIKQPGTNYPVQTNP